MSNGPVVKVGQRAKVLGRRKLDAVSHLRARSVLADVSPLLGRPTRRLAVSRVRNGVGFTQPEFARLLGYSTRAVAGWESGKQLDVRARRKLTEVDRLLNALASLIAHDAVGPWLREDNSAFGGRSPMHLIERGEADRLWQMIHQIDAKVAD